MKELERNNTIIETEEGEYDTSKVIENIRYDFNRNLVNEIQALLKNFVTIQRIFKWLHS